MMKQGFSCLTRSASKAGFEEEPPFEIWLEKRLGAKMFHVLSGIAFAIAIPLSILLFMVIPAFISSLFAKVVSTPLLLTVIEGVIKIVILSSTCGRFPV